jgi:hypothetical protein
MLGMGLPWYEYGMAARDAKLDVPLTSSKSQISGKEKKASTSEHDVLIRCV